MRTAGVDGKGTIKKKISGLEGNFLAEGRVGRGLASKAA